MVSQSNRMTDSLTDGQKDAYSSLLQAGEGRRLHPEGGRGRGYQAAGCELFELKHPAGIWAVRAEAPCSPLLNHGPASPADRKQGGRKAACRSAGGYCPPKRHGVRL
ncbi:hypothetical protein SKAU_G00005580 [Synaphobranchus kaupii]|uniref:Uncharacterized protein n=1 Tax=Synaphobranchus kaupii TaxID=118154 RepID=A0A9Q1GA21_SYNKA|nr:hypothetical protein SKAU_G00005580 [Synaphobranchus kaupii]